MDEECVAEGKMNNCAVSAIVVIHGGEVRTSLKQHSQHNKERKEIYNSTIIYTACLQGLTSNCIYDSMILLNHMEVRLWDIVSRLYETCRRGKERLRSSR